MRRESPRSQEIMPERKIEFTSSVDNTENKGIVQFSGSRGQFVFRSIPLKTIH
jgi:hypothetical protein